MDRVLVLLYQSTHPADDGTAESVEEWSRHGWGFSDEAFDGGSGYFEQDAGLVGNDVGGAGAVVQKGNLTKEVAHSHGPQGGFPPVDQVACPQFAFQDQVH